MYKKRRKALNSMQSGQKPKGNNATGIPYCKGTAYILKKAAAKFNLNVPIKPCPNIFQHKKSDRDPVNPLDTAGIYRIEYTDENNKFRKSFCLKGLIV